MKNSLRKDFLTQMSFWSGRNQARMTQIGLLKNQTDVTRFGLSSSSCWIKTRIIQKYIQKSKNRDLYATFSTMLVSAVLISAKLVLIIFESLFNLHERATSKSIQAQSTWNFTFLS